MQLHKLRPKTTLLHNFSYNAKNFPSFGMLCLTGIGNF